MDAISNPDQENLAAACNASVDVHALLSKRSVALKDTRLLLAKAEEERAEFSRKLQLEIRDRKALAVKLTETQAYLEDVTEKYKHSESNRKYLSRTLQKSSVRESPVKASPVVRPAQPESPEVARLAARLADLSAELQIEKAKRQTLKSAVKAKVERFEETKAGLETALADARWARDAARTDLESLRELIRDQNLEISSLKETVSELEKFKVQAMREWMLHNIQN